MVKIYVASAFKFAKRAQKLAYKLSNECYCVTSDWYNVSLTDKAAIFEKNLCEISQCDVLVALTDVGNPRATYCEIGVALALGKRVVWIQHENGRGANDWDGAPNVTVVKVHKASGKVLLKKVLDCLLEKHSDVQCENTQQLTFDFESSSDCAQNVQPQSTCTCGESSLPHCTTCPTKE